MRALSLTFLVSALLIAGIWTPTSAAKNVATGIPDLKISVEFEVIKTLKNMIIGPLIQTYLSNLTIPGPINIEKAIGLATLYLNASNIHVESLVIDWSNTNLIAAPQNRIQLMISGVNLGMSFNYDIKYITELSSGKGTLNIKNLFASIVLELKAAEVETGFIAFVYDTKIWWDEITVALESSILNTVINDYLSLEKTSVQQDFDNMVNTQVNATLIGFSSVPLQFNFTVPHTNSTYGIRLAPTTIPTVEQYTVNGTNFNYLNVPLDIIIKNLKTNQTARIKESDNMPSRVQNTSDIEIMLSNNLVNQIVWTGIDSGVIDLEISNKTLADKNITFNLTTSNINILFPGVYDYYGDGKGIYLKISASSPFSHVFVRGGRVVGEISLGLKVFVDKDSSHYPDTLANCTTCEQALELNLTALFAVHAFNINATTFGMNVIDLKFYELQLIDSKVFVNLPLTSELFNSIGGALLPTINDLVKSGFNNPFFGIFGINKMEFLLAVDYIYAGIGFWPLKQSPANNRTVIA